MPTWPNVEATRDGTLSNGEHVVTLATLVPKWNGGTKRLTATGKASHRSAALGNARKLLQQKVTDHTDAQDRKRIANARRVADKARKRRRP